MCSFTVLYPRAYISHQADIMFEFDMTDKALYAPIRLFNLGLHNYKVEIQNKQIKTFQVVLLTRPSVCGAGSVCVGGGGGRGRLGGGGGTYSLDNLPVCSIKICFRK